MKITFIGGFYPEVGGPFSALKNLLEILNRRKHDVSIMSPLPPSYDETKLKFVNKLSYNVEFFKQGLFGYVIPSYSKYWKKELKNKARDTEIFHITGIFDYYSILISNLGIPYIVSLRGSFMKEAYGLTKFKTFKKNIFMKLFGEKIINNAALIHVMCKEEFEHFLCFFPQLKEKVRIVPNGLNLSEFQAFSPSRFAEKYPVLKDKKYILFLSRINIKKGLDLLIKAFNMLRKESDLYLLIVGPDNEGYKKEVEKWINDFGLKNRVIFTGMLYGANRLSAFIDAEMFVLPSYSENFGMAVIEAMACGTPVVISNKVGIAREIKANNAGIVVETTSESVYNGIKSLLNNESLRKQISENGKNMVVEYYDRNKVTDKMIEMYKEVLGK